MQKIVEIPELQYTDEKVDFIAESSEDSVDAAGTIPTRSGLLTL